MSAAQRFPGLATTLITQVERVNGTDDPRLRAAHARIADLENQLRAARARIADLERGDLADSAGHLRASLTHAGRPAATIAEVAAFYGVSQSTVWRQLQSGRLAGFVVNGSRRYVYLDQAFTFRSHPHRGT